MADDLATYGFGVRFIVEVVRGYWKRSPNAASSVWNCISMRTVRDKYLSRTIGDVLQ